MLIAVALCSRCRKAIDTDAFLSKERENVVSQSARSVLLLGAGVDRPAPLPASFCHSSAGFCDTRLSFTPPHTAPLQTSGALHVETPS